MSWIAVLTGLAPLLIAILGVVSDLFGRKAVQAAEEKKIKEEAREEVRELGKNGVATASDYMRVGGRVDRMRGARR